MELEPILGNIEKSGMVNVDLGKIVRNLKTNQEVRGTVRQIVSLYF